MKRQLFLLTVAVMVASGGPALAESRNTKTLKMWQDLIGGAKATEDAFRPIEARRRARAERAMTAGTRRALFGARRNGEPQTVQMARLAAPPPPVQPQRIIKPQYLPTVVAYETAEKPGTIIIDPQTKYLYLVLEGGQAQRYGVGVGRDGFGWSGSVTIGRKAEWPTWTPPKAMIERQPELAEYAGGMPGGPNNPLGARALYLFKNGSDTLYRIHGSNEPWTIGQAVSSGCFRMRNEDVTELFSRVGVGTRVVVL
jgi:lipoprotein-anchoring transpeptidase ErfK/SrfK